MVLKPGSLLNILVLKPGSLLVQTMTEAEHNRPIPKLFDNRPSASAAEVFGEKIRPIILPKTFGHISKKGP